MARPSPGRSLPNSTKLGATDVGQISAARGTDSAKGHRTPANLGPRSPQIWRLPNPEMPQPSMRGHSKKQIQSTTICQNAVPPNIRESADTLRRQAVDHAGVTISCSPHASLTPATIIARKPSEQQARQTRYHGHRLLDTPSPWFEIATCKTRPDPGPIWGISEVDLGRICMGITNVHTAPRPICVVGHSSSMTNPSARR